MSLQTKNTERVLDTKKSKEKVKNEDSANKKIPQSEHDKWKQLQASKKCADINEVSYWKVVSHCTRL